MRNNQKNAEDKSLTQNGQANDTVPPFSESVDTRSAESSTSVASDEKAQPPTDSAGVSPLACLEEAEADEEENDQSGRVATLDQALSDSESATSSPQGDRDTGSAQKQAPSPKGESALSRRKPRVSHKVKYSTPFLFTQNTPANFFSVHFSTTLSFLTLVVFFFRTNWISRLTQSCKVYCHQCRQPVSFFSAVDFTQLLLFSQYSKSELILTL